MEPNHMDCKPSTSKVVVGAKYLDFNSGQLVDIKTDTNLQVLPDEDTTEVCDICKSPKKDQELFGHFFRTNFSKCHYYCLLLTTSITQSLRNDKAGILGFGRLDIWNARSVIASTICNYCETKCANLECAAQGCDRKYHLVCGHANNCQVDFSNFASYCHEHTTLRRPDEWPVASIEASVCFICYSTIELYNPLDHFTPPCCEDGWFHRRCLQKCADSSGYTFKCPLCQDGDKQSFRTAAKQFGIFIWDREASWEFDGRYDDIDKSKCTAEHCRTRRSKKDFLTCFACGQKIGHAQCFDVAEQDMESYTCERCFEQSFLDIIPPLDELDPPPCCKKEAK